MSPFKCLAFSAVAAIACQPGLAFPAGPDAPPASSSMRCPGQDQAFAREAEALITQAIDAERARLAPGAPPLTADPVLIRIAEQRSCDMAHGEPFSHTDAQGRFIAGDMVRHIFGPYGVVGENIGEMSGTVMMIGARPFGPEEFAQVAVNGWIESPGHRANILDPTFDLSGIGVVMVGGEAVATQIFHGSAPGRGGHP